MPQIMIRSADGLSVEILPEKGATVVDIRKDGVPFLYRDDSNLSSSERPRCGIPFLFPCFGRMKDEQYQWDGKSYPMAIHGFAHTSEWKVESQQESKLVLRLSSDDAIYAMYPFRFRVTLTFTAENGTLRIRQDYENLDTVPLPYHFGFHPYFLTEKPENLQVTTDADARIDFATGQFLPFGHGTIALSEPENAPEVGAALAGLKGSVILEDWKAGRKLTMSFSPDFPQLILWHPKGVPFVCVEPINGTPNGFNTGNYLTLQPGERKTVWLEIHPEIL